MVTVYGKDFDYIKLKKSTRNNKISTCFILMKTTNKESEANVANSIARKKGHNRPHGVTKLKINRRFVNTEGSKFFHKNEDY